MFSNNEKHRLGAVFTMNDAVDEWVAQSDVVFINNYE
jgi:hypothetical protein